jgi:transcriptional regulator with XRE-family HTH domain
VALGQEEIGRRVKEARDDADLTQQELADRIGIQQGQTISNYERGITEIPSKRLRRIAEATGKPLVFFVQDPDAPTPPEPRREQLDRMEADIAEILRRLAAREESGA